MQSLFGEEIPPKRRVTRRKKTGRSQYRRAAWEDYLLAESFVTDLFADKPLPKEKRKKRIDALADRYHARTPLWRAGDPGPDDIDWVRFLTDLGEAMREEWLAKDGLRYMSAGVHEVRPGDPTTPWRAQIWDRSTDKHKHIGYAPTRGEAIDKVIEYYKRTAKIDIRERTRPPDWLKECLGMAMRLQADTSEAAGGKDWAELPATFMVDDEEED